MFQIRKLASGLGLLAVMLAVTITPVYAFEGQTGDIVTIAAGEVIDDDLYVTAQTFTLDGTVTGDLVVFAQTIFINGEVKGDLIAAGQTVVINGNIADDARIAGAGLQVGDEAVIGGDLVSAGASLETRPDSSVKGELVVGAGQALLAGVVAGDVLAGTGGLELRGAFGGDILAYVGESDESAPPMNFYMTNSPITMPAVRPGLKVDDEAAIAGNLRYTSSREASIPAGIVVGQITRSEPAYEESGKQVPETPPSTTSKVVDWSLDLLRSIVTLVLFGLLLAWLTPGFLSSLGGKIQSQFAPSLGWGVIAYAGFFFMLLVIVVAMIIGGMITGFLTLGSLTGMIIFVGLLLIFGGILGFVLVTAFLTKISVGNFLGKWIFSRAKSPLAEHKYWPMILGVVIIALLVALPFIGWLFGLIVILLGLGALWLWSRERLVKQAA